MDAVDIIGAEKLSMIGHAYCGMHEELKILVNDLNENSSVEIILQELKRIIDRHEANVMMWTNAVTAATGVVLSEKDVEQICDRLKAAYTKTRRVKPND